jgi:hypothetical protein
VRPYRFSIAGLMGVVAALGLGLTALRSPTPLKARTAVTAALASVCAAGVAAVVRPGPGRAGWLGFAVFGAAHFVWAFGYEGVPIPTTLTRHLLDALEPQVLPYLVESGAAVYVGKPSPAYAQLAGAIASSPVGPAHVYFHAYRQAGQATFTLVVGLIGAAVGLALGRRRVEAEGD